MSRQKIIRIAFWLTTILGPVSFVIGGTMFLSQAEQPVSQLARLGFPPFLIFIVGTWKLLGAIVIAVPKLPLLKEWAYAGFFILLSSAFATHLLAGDPLFSSGPAQAFSPLLFLILVVASYLLRPPSRRLPQTDFLKINGG